MLSALRTFAASLLVPGLGFWIVGKPKLGTLAALGVTGSILAVRRSKQCQITPSRTESTHRRSLNTSSAWPGDDDYAGIDIFRFDDSGKVVEHWDVLQIVPSSSLNDNGLF